MELISFPRCLVEWEEWAVQEEVQQKESQFNTPLRSHLRKYTKEKLQKSQLIETEYAKHARVVEVKMVQIQHVRDAKEGA